jgi:hypothetical protein
MYKINQGAFIRSIIVYLMPLLVGIQIADASPTSAQLYEESAKTLDKIKQLNQQIYVSRDQLNDKESELFTAKIREPSNYAIDFKIRELQISQADTSEIENERIEEYSDHYTKERALTSKLTQLQSKVIDYSDIDRTTAQLNEDLRDLIAYKKQALTELRQGYYCSQCSRPASQIIRETGTTFEQHLNDVSGRAIPMPEEKVRSKEAEFDRKIQALQNKIAQNESKKRQRQQEHQKEVAAAQKNLDQQEQQHKSRLAALDKKREQIEKAHQEKNDAEIAKLESEKKAMWDAYTQRVTQLDEQVKQRQSSLDSLEQQKRSLDQQYFSQNLAAQGQAFSERLQAEATLREARMKAFLAQMQYQAYRPKSPRYYHSDDSVRYQRSTENPFDAVRNYPPAESVFDQVDNSLSERNRRKALEKAQEQRLEDIRRSQSQYERAQSEQETVVQQQTNDRAEVAQSRIKAEDVSVTYQSVSDISNDEGNYFSNKLAWKDDVVYENDFNQRKPEFPQGTNDRLLADAKQSLSTMLDRNLDKLEEAASYRTEVVKKNADELWRKTSSLLENTTALVRDKKKHWYGDSLKDKAEDLVFNYLENHDQPFNSRTLESVNKTIESLDPRRIAIKEWIDKGHDKLAEYLYEKESGQSFDALSEYDQETEKFFYHAKRISSPREYLNRLNTKFEALSSRWYEEIFGSDDD